MSCSFMFLDTIVLYIQTKIKFIHILLWLDFTFAIVGLCVGLMPLSRECFLAQNQSADIV